MPEHEIQILYSQFSVHTQEVDAFPDWTDAHVAQGVAWRPGHASFGVPDHDGKCLLDIAMTDRAPVAGPGTERLLGVPFDVGIRGRAAVSTILETLDLDIPAGAYQLWFELREEPELTARGLAYRIVLRFQRVVAADFVIIRSGAEMSAREITLRTAEPDL